ncbi:MAG: division/cell wall cluster transcriptional repressor MraZ [Pseudomonadales bacterium]|nr:division/cell wall cluster transcriptional repressor MraZ [Pseudomonadales bacterium]
MLFRGLNSINIDAKGRMAMPARYREIIERHCQGKMVVTIEEEGESLVIYPIIEFEEIQQKVENLSSFHPVSKRLKRLFIGHATDVELDGSGRILIPPTLRAYVGLDKKAALIGQGKKLELWDEDLWNVKRDKWLKETNSSAALSEELQNLSL